MELTRDRALALLKDYNREPFHLQHAYTVEAVMRDFAREQGYGDEADFWGIVGLLHDVDYERYPGEHCVKAREILAEQGAGERLIHAVVSHGYGIVSDVAPEHEMEKILFAVDELTGLIGAVAIMRPSKRKCGRPAVYRTWSSSHSKRNIRPRASPPAVPGMSSPEEPNSSDGSWIPCSNVL